MVTPLFLFLSTIVTVFHPLSESVVVIGRSRGYDDSRGRHLTKRKAA